MSSPKDRDQLAAEITRQASTQTYWMIRLFVDRGMTKWAYRAYAYFRWVDDIIDASDTSREDRIGFARRQRCLLEDLYSGVIPLDLSLNEEMLQDLVNLDSSRDSGLHTYLDQMMSVMEFDAWRRGRLVSHAQLDTYTNMLAASVTEAMHYFIGHTTPTPRSEYRYLAVTAAHLTHMLRDTIDDTGKGYYNIPHEVLLEKGLTPLDHDQESFRKWVCQQTQLARKYFESGKAYLHQVRNLRCRLAGLAYAARFEWVLWTIERENYCLRPEYSDRKRLISALWMAWHTLCSIFSATHYKETYTQHTQTGREASQA